jgi:hypothetical protein
VLFTSRVQRSTRFRVVRKSSGSLGQLLASDPDSRRPGYLPVTLATAIPQSTAILKKPTTWRQCRELLRDNDDYCSVRRLAATAQGLNPSGCRQDNGGAAHHSLHCTPAARLLRHRFGSGLNTHHSRLTALKSQPRLLPLLARKSASLHFFREHVSLEEPHRLCWLGSQRFGVY